MTDEAVAVQLENHNQRLNTVEDFVHDVKKTLNKIFFALLAAGLAALIDVVVRK